MNLAKVGKQERASFLNLKKYTNLNWLRIFVLLFVFAGFNSTFQAQSRMMESKQLIKFCASVDQLSDAYSEAVDGQMKNVKDIFDGILAKQAVSTFPMDKVELKTFYQDKLKTIQQIERIYSMDGAGLKDQARVVAMVKSSQREMKKVDMFNRAFAEYVNGKRYQSDPEFQEGKLMYYKVDQSLRTIKSDLSGIQKEIARIENNSLQIIMGKHELKNVLLPMSNDLLFLSQLFANAEISQDMEILVEQIQEKRVSLAESREARNKEAGYLLKKGAKAELYSNFYNKYQSALTKNEIQLSKGGELSLTDLEELVELNDIVLDQLKTSFEKLKGSGSLSQLK